jgi:hypothetical protein
MNGSNMYLPLIDSLHTLLRDYPIQADLSSIKVDTASPRPVVLVQLADTELAAIARGLLEWHRTLADSRCVAARTSDGAIVQLGVCGHSDVDGTHVEVWGYAPYDEPLIGADLQPRERVSLPLEELAVWAVGLVGR